MLKNDEIAYIYNALLGLGLHLWQAKLCELKLLIWLLQSFFSQWKGRKRSKNKQNNFF